MFGGNDQFTHQPKADSGASVNSGADLSGFSVNYGTSSDMPWWVWPALAVAALMWFKKGRR